MTRSIATIFVISLISVSSFAGLNVTEATKLKHVKALSDLIVGAVWLPDSNLLIASKQSSPPQVLIYDVDFGKNLSPMQRQDFKGFAPHLMRTEDSVLALKYFGRTGKSSDLYRLNDNAWFQLIHEFPQDIKNIEATEKSSILATVDYAHSSDLGAVTPRLKLFNAKKEEATMSIERLGNAVGIITTRQFLSGAKHGTARVTALAMSRMARTDNVAANRVIALAHTQGASSTLHLWFYPSLKSDFSNGRGHQVFLLGDSIDTLEFSPNTLGLLLATNKKRGEIYVMKFDLMEKTLTSLKTLKVEKASSPESTHIAARFASNDAVVAGINDSIFLFEKDRNGTYQRTDIQPADFVDNEYFSVIEVYGTRFISVGTKGSVQFGTID